MSAFTPADIPSEVNTIEELAAWAISALAEINPTGSVQTGPATVEPVVTAQTFRLENQQTNPERFVGVVYLPLQAGWRSNGSIYTGGIAEISGGALPASFRQN